MKFLTLAILLVLTSCLHQEGDFGLTSSTVTQTLSFADGICNAPPLVLRVEDAYDGAIYPEDAALGDDLKYHVRLEIPADGEAFVQFEHGGSGMSYQVFGMPKEGTSLQKVQQRQWSKAMFPSTTVTASPSEYEYLILAISQVKRATTASTPIKLTAFDQQPKHQYINGIAINCAGERTQRVVVSSCNPNAFVGAWAREQGLNVIDSLPFQGVAGLALIELPAGIDPNSEPPSVRKKIKQDTINYFVEEDFFVRLPQHDLRPNYVAEGGGWQYSSHCSALTYNPLPTTVGRNEENEVRVAIVDSGVENEQLYDLWQQYRNRRTIEGVFSKPQSIGYDFIDGDDIPEDRMGHGTSVAGTIVGGYNGEAPLTLLHYKIFDEDGKSTYFGAVTAIYAAVVNGADIINLSWGISQDEYPRALKCAVEYASSQGVIIVTSAGNDGRNIDLEPQWPAAFAGAGHEKKLNVITVASYEVGGGGDAISLAKFSNYGEQNVTLAAYATAESPTFYNPAVLDTPYGTSISAPLVSRHIASLKGNNPNTFRIGDFYSALSSELPEGLIYQDRILPLKCD